MISLFLKSLIVYNVNQLTDGMRYSFNNQNIILKSKSCFEDLVQYTRTKEIKNEFLKLI